MVCNAQDTIENSTSHTSWSNRANSSMAGVLLLSKTDILPLSMARFTLIAGESSRVVLWLKMLHSAHSAGRDDRMILFSHN